MDAANAWHLQNGKYHSFLLPDITLWSAPGEHHEVKHKNPTRSGKFGLEKYRLEALIWFMCETRQNVFYTIHDHSLAGGREVKENRIEDWITVNILDLESSPDREEKRGPTWCNGQRIEAIIYYWPTTCWIPLEDMWNYHSSWVEEPTSQISDASPL